MKLGSIIERLREQCPTLEGRVGGAAEYGALAAKTNVKTPYAFVLPLGETADYYTFNENQYRQGVVAQFGVLLYLTLANDVTARRAYDYSQDIKKEVFKAILGAALPDTDPITYDGEAVIDVSKARLMVQWEFNVPYDIDWRETAQGVEIEALGELEGIDAQIDPAPADYVDGVKFSINMKGG